MRSRLAEGGALAMRLSLVFLNAARRGAAFFVAVEVKTKVSLPSPNGSVDQRKSPSCHARIGALVQRCRRSSPIKMMVRHAFADHPAWAMVAYRRPADVNKLWG